MSGKRRLLVIQSSGSDDTAEAAERSPWQWVGFGAFAIFVAWLPLSAIALAVAARVSPHWNLDDPAQLYRAAIAIGAIYCLAIAIGALGGGFMTGRWGSGGVGVREASLAGLAAATVATALSSASFGFAPRTLLVVVVAMPMAALGGVLGRRRRRR